MKLAVTTVGRKGPEDEEHNIERLRAAGQALQKAAKLRAGLIVLPGGFLTAHNSRTREAVAESLISEAKQLDIAIIFGVDQKVKNPNTDWEILIKGFLLPYYGYAWSPSGNIIHCWQQRSSTSDNQWFVSNSHCEEARLVRVSDETLGVLMCGEIFNQRIRNALARHTPRPKVIVDVAHVGAGFRVWQGMRKLAEQGLATVCSVHAQCEYAMKYSYIPERGNISSRIPDEYVFGPPRIELKLWTF